MESSQPEEFRFGLEGGELEELLAAADDWDGWQLEEVASQVGFAAEERRAAELPDPEAEVESSLMTVFFTQGEIEPWGIDEPLTEADFWFLDEDWPEV